MKQIALILFSLFAISMVNSCSEEKTEATNNQDETRMEGMDHDKMKMDTKSDNKMAKMDSKDKMSSASMFEGWKPTETVKVEGVKAEFYIVNLAYANNMLKMAEEVYVESMHPHIISEKSGKCSICGMDLEKKKATAAVLDTKGRTHHIDIILRDEKTGEKITDAKTKLKIIAPDNKSVEKMMTLHMGTWETDIDLKSPGKYGMISLIRIGDKDRVFKFNFENAKPKTM